MNPHEQAPALWQLLQHTAAALQAVVDGGGLALRTVVVASLGDLQGALKGPLHQIEGALTILGQDGAGRALRLSGPGLRVPALFRAEGLPEDFVSRWAAA